MGLELSFKEDPLDAPTMRVGSTSLVRSKSAEDSSYSSVVRLGYLNCRCPCSSVAISTDRNCSEPDLIPVDPACYWNGDLRLS